MWSAECIKGGRPDVCLKRVLQSEGRTRARPSSSLPEFLGASTQRFLWKLRSQAHMTSRVSRSIRAIAVTRASPSHPRRRDTSGLTARGSAERSIHSRSVWFQCQDIAIAFLNSPPQNNSVEFRNGEGRAYEKPETRDGHSGDHLLVDD